MDKMIKHVNWKPLSVLTASLLLAACGGGGGGGSDAGVAAPPAGNPGNPVTTPTNPGAATTTVTGAITKGPVSGATVQLFEIDQFGNPVGAAIATGVSGDDGSFQVDLTTIDASADLLLVASGGSYLDESDQETDVNLKRRIQLGANDTFLSLLPAGQAAVAVTPFTTALVLRGRILGGPDGTFSAKFADAKAAFDAQAGFDVLSTIPANPVAPEATATEAQKQYALLLGGIANLINNVAIQSGAAAPTYDMVVAVTFDLVDGQFDGQYFGQTNVPGSGQTPVQLPQNLNFSEEVNRFRNNNFASFDGTVLPSIEVTTFANSLPTANAGADITVNQTVAGQLDGSASSDPDSGLFYSWVQTAGTPVTLDNNQIVNPSFTAPARLIGNETLTFELTVIDTVGFTSVDTVNVQVVGALANDFYVVDEGEVGEPGVGLDIDGGGRVTLTDATTGTLFTDIGPQPFTYTVNGNALTVNFLTPFLQDDFDEERDPDGDGVFDFLLVEERVDQFIFTLVTDNPNGDALTIRTIGNEVILPLDDPEGTVLGTFPIDDTDPITAYDIAQATPFSIAAGDKRTLLFNVADVIPTFENDELYPEVFEFIDATSGVTRESNQTFTYSVDASGHLNVNFLNGDSAKYINLVTRPTGDVMGTEYTLAQPFFPGDSTSYVDAVLSFPENQAVAKPTTLAEAAGVYSGLVFSDLIDGGARADVRLNPDGTGSVNIETLTSTSRFFDFDEVFSARSGFGVCWGLDAANNIVIDRTFSLNIAYPNSFSSETDPTFCAGLTEDRVDFQFVLTQFDSDGTTFKFFDIGSENKCAFIPTSDCLETPELVRTGTGLRVNTRVPLTATPPVAALDPVQTPDATPITIDLVANDIARDNPIDPASVQLGRGPFQGTITSFDQATGVLVYTPNPGIRSDLIEYTVADTAGNRSQIQITQIDINPCAVIDGVRGFYDVFTRDCDYSGLGGPGSPVLTDVSFGPLPEGGVHLFTDSLVIGEDFNTDADLAAAGITQGGDGPSLNIAAGTVMAFTNPSSVVSISRGSQINVGGTPTDPVIMTSQSDVQSKRDVDGGLPGFQAYNNNGQWGGLVIQGFGLVNDCLYSGSVATNDLALSGECHFQAPSQLGHFGGANNTDNSGAINYLQIRYAGGFVGLDNSGGLALGGVGSGTSISNVQVYSAQADGIQLAGGEVDLQNVISLYAEQAGILAEYGYSGSVSNALIIQDQRSGEFCVDTSGADADVLTPAEIDALITQGINTQPVYTNFTCVISADSFNGIPGVGFDFINGAHATLVDSIAFTPGRDQFTNYCVDVNDQSLQAIQDGDLNVTANAFACPSTTPNILPDLTPLQSFLVASGNSFASLTPGSSNPAPVASAATGNVLVEGSPLIFTPPVANISIDGSPAGITPIGTFIGAVQQSADWTDGWTFGLRPGSRLAPLWYEQPILDVPKFIPAPKGQLLTLDASQSVSANGGLTFQWNQLNGDPVNFTNPTSASTQLTVPGAGTNLTFSPGVTQLELVATDAAGLQTREVIDLFAQASIPEDFYAAAEFIIPFQFNRNIGTGPRILINLADNTGTYLNGEGATDFTWTDTATDFTMDFTSNGGLISGPNTSFEDVDGNTGNGQEEITRTIRTDTIVYTLLSDNGAKKIFDATNTGVESVFDVTNNVALPDDPFVDELSQNAQVAVVGVNNGLFVDIEGGETQVGLADLSPQFPSLINPNLLREDQFSFSSDGTGFALLKNQGFTWFVDNSFGSELIIDFADGDRGEYVSLFESELGNAVGVTYTKANGDVTAEVFASIEDNPLTNWGSQAFIAGIYESNQALELNDGSFIDTKLIYRLHPDGTGQLEIEINDLATGDLVEILPSGNGICWNLESADTLVWYRTSSFGQQGPGVAVPSISTCSLLNTSVPDNTLINFQRNIELFDINSSGQLLTFTENITNQIGIDPLGDNTIVEFTDTFIRNFESVIPFTTSPPLAFADSFTISPGIPTTVNVLSNDLDVDSTIDVTTVTIVVPPTQGTATVNPTTGEIDYSPNAVFSDGPTDKLQYRVFDQEGNESTIGTVTFTDATQV
jgi:hypothetical protein